MAAIENFLNPRYVSQLLNERLSVSEFCWSNIVVHDVQTIKENIVHDYYNIVVAYAVSYVNNGLEHQAVIYCSAHSNDSRRQSMENLEFIWRKNIPGGQFLTNKPLFYESQYGAMFYLGLSGDNLCQYFTTHSREEISSQLTSIAQWLARLHTLTLGFNEWPESRIQKIGQIVPGRERALERIQRNIPQHYERFVRIYDYLEAWESRLWPTPDKLAIIHGDVHPENVIITDNGVAIIDWSDLCSGDPLRDVGSFSQQLIFMGLGQINDESYWHQAQDKFLSAYSQAMGNNLPENWLERFRLYYYFTAFRTAIYFVTKSGPEPERAEGLLEEIEINLLYL